MRTKHHESVHETIRAAFKTFRDKCHNLLSDNYFPTILHHEPNKYMCVSLIFYLCNVFISHYIPTSVFLRLLYGNRCLTITYRINQQTMLQMQVKAISGNNCSDEIPWRPELTLN